MSWLTKLRIMWGSICPVHPAPTYWGESYGKLRCSVTWLKWSNQRRETVVGTIRDHLRDDSPIRAADNGSKIKVPRKAGND